MKTVWTAFVVLLFAHGALGLRVLSRWRLAVGAHALIGIWSCWGVLVLV